MLSGFNTNLHHRGVLFHVQTEDSGRANPHIISHLFHGGNILVSRKSEYRELLEADGLDDVVREMMEAQHKDMLRSLVRGECDAPITERLGPDVFLDVSVQTDAILEEIDVEELEPELEAMLVEEPAAPPPAENSRDQIARAFGDGVVSQKPLDEVVLDYLVASARKRKRPSS